MTLYPHLITVGTIDAGATAIQADMSFLGTASNVAVTLTTDYAMIEPVEGGYSARPFTVGRDAANLEYPRTIPSGTTITLLPCEAAAIVNAGAATYA